MIVLDILFCKNNWYGLADPKLSTSAFSIIQGYCSSHHIVHIHYPHHQDCLFNEEISDISGSCFQYQVSPFTGMEY